MPALVSSPTPGSVDRSARVSGGRSALPGECLNRRLIEVTKKTEKFNSRFPETFDRQELTTGQIVKMPLVLRDSPFQSGAVEALYASKLLGQAQGLKGNIKRRTTCLRGYL